VTCTSITFKSEDSMQLSRLTVGLLIFAATSACHDTTAPSGWYVLTAVDGHSLPFTSFGIDVSSTLLSSTLVLNSGGGALRIDHYRDHSANSGMTSERNEQVSGAYTIANDSITVRWTSLPNDVGVFSNSTVTLTEVFGAQTSSVYSYRDVFK
jgi:hypothetical protein